MHCMSTFFSLGSIDAQTWHVYRLYGPRMGPIDNISLVTGLDFSDTDTDRQIKLAKKTGTLATMQSNS